MNYPIHLFLLGLLACSAMAVDGSEGNKIPEMTKDRQLLIEKMKEKAKQYLLSTRAKIDFYGKVVNQSGEPIEGVQVILVVRDLAWKWTPDGQEDKKIELNTDHLGLFKVKDEKGHFLFIDDLEKDGYEYDLTKNPQGFEYQVVENVIDPPFVGDPENPVVFTLRKRGTVDYLLTNSFTWHFKKSKNNSYRPLLLGEWNDSYGKEMNLGASRSEKSKCLEISCGFNEDYSEFELSFKCVVEGSGVFLSNTLLYEAPADGYQPEVIYSDNMVRSIEEGSIMGLSDKKLYLYVKGPDERYYSRIDLTMSTRPVIEFDEDASVRIRGKIYTNPNGRRYLDYNPTYNDNEKIFRNRLLKKRSQASMEADRNKKPFDEKAFKEEIDTKYKNRDWRQVED